METEPADFLYELGVLKRVRRSGWWLAGIADAESVAAHSHRVAAIAYLLAAAEGADAGRAAAMAIFHDAIETRLTDLHRLARSYLDGSAEAKRRVAADQTRGLPAALAAALGGLAGELESGSSREAAVVRDADALECLLQAREYGAAGHDVREWIASSRSGLRSATARRWAKAILKTDPAAWRRRQAAPTRPRRRKAR